MAGPKTYGGMDSQEWATYGYPMMMMSGVISGVGSVLTAQSQANALNTQAQFYDWQAKENTKRAGIQLDALALNTQSQIAAQGNKANEMIGKQRTSFASQGVNVNSGSAATAQSQTSQISAANEMTIRNNAALEAWGIKTGSLQTSGQQQLQALGARTQASQTLALGGAQAAKDLTDQQRQYEEIQNRLN